MYKSVKPKNNTYIDSTGITHNRQILKDILNNMITVETDGSKMVLKFANGIAIYTNRMYYYKNFNFAKVENIYLAADPIYFEFDGLFVERPKWFVDLDYAGGHKYWLTEQGYEGTNNRTANFFLASGNLVSAGGNVECQINCLAIGRWK